MAKAKVKQRKDSKGRVLQKGESQRTIDGMYIYTYVDPYGKRCYVYSKDLFVLREKEQDLIKAQMDGLDYYVGGHATVNMTFDRYMSTKYNLRASTRTNYIYMFNKFVRNEFGNMFLSDVKYTDVKLFYYRLINEKNIAINTLETIHTVIHPIFTMAVRDDIIRKNPSDGVMAEIKKNSGKNKGIRHALTIEQQKAFINVIRYSPEYYHWYPLFTTLLGTGMRIGECVGLTWNDVDFEHRSISVNRTATYYTRDGKAGFVISEPKTESGKRKIPMMDTVFEALKSEKDRQKRDGFSSYELDGCTGFVFTNKMGSLHNPHCVNSAIKRIYQMHNATEIIDAKKERREPVIIPHFSCHILRHTFCSRLCENEVNIKVIQEIMGHANVETTLDIYTEVNFNKKQESLEALSKRMDFF